MAALRLRHWYNGYGWCGEETVYNPFDILRYFQYRKFLPYWYKTGTPRYLYRRMARGNILPTELIRLKIFWEELSSFELDPIRDHALLFQCGYLTIIGEQELNGKYVYILDHPNEAVRRSLNQEWLRAVRRGGW